MTKILEKNQADLVRMRIFISACAGERVRKRTFISVCAGVCGRVCVRERAVAAISSTSAKMEI